MKDKEVKFVVGNKEYKAIFNLNVAQAIQSEYETIEQWGELIDGKNGELNIKALLFGMTLAINEAIDIENENKEIPDKLLTEKQVGRIITEIGMQKATNQMQEIIVASSSEDNAKNV